MPDDLKSESQEAQGKESERAESGVNFTTKKVHWFKPGEPVADGGNSFCFVSSYCIRPLRDHGIYTNSGSLVWAELNGLSRGACRLGCPKGPMMDSVHVCMCKAFLISTWDCEYFGESSVLFSGGWYSGAWGRDAVSVKVRS
jgi:hypothetical protein